MSLTPRFASSIYTVYIYIPYVYLYVYLYVYIYTSSACLFEKKPKNNVTQGRATAATRKRQRRAAKAPEVCTQAVVASGVHKVLGHGSGGTAEQIMGFVMDLCVCFLRLKSPSNKSGPSLTASGMVFASQLHSEMVENYTKGKHIVGFP